MSEIRSILVGTDLGESSDEVLRAAAALAALTDAHLHVLYTFDLAEPYPPEVAEEVGFQERLDVARQQLDEQIQRLVVRDVPVASAEIVIHVAHRAIIERAQAADADLIVLGPHRKRGFADALLGSTADRVIRTADVPCLIVRAPLSLPLRRVLVPIDLSDPAIAALDSALRWAVHLGPHGSDGGPRARVTALHVIPRVFDYRDVAPDRMSPAPELREAVEAALTRASGASAVEVDEDVRWGDSPAEDIVKAADEVGAELIVMATHGRGAIQRALVGSVKSGVARSAHCPVLLIPPALWRGE